MRSTAPAISILIPSWNNLPYLQLCIESIRKNSYYHEHEIIVHVNEGSDGTAEWLQKEGIKFTSSEQNIGICKAMNQAFTLSTKNYILYINDDMYVLPDWDKHLLRESEQVTDRYFMLSATMIEPENTGNDVVIHADFGNTLDTFREEELQKAKLRKDHWSGSSWPPVMVPRTGWELVGGFSEEFSPGMYSDPDLAMKLWQIGCRVFKGVGDSLVYHFQCKSTGRVEKNDGRMQFVEKWGISAADFYKYYLKMGETYQGKLSEPSFTRDKMMKIAGRFKRKSK